MTARRALVVDDEGILRRLIRTVLESGGYDVIEANDGETGLLLAGRERPDVIVLDVMMPGMDGFEVCRRLDHSVSKVVMLTARDDAGTEETALASGADAFMTKPFSPNELLEVIDRVLAP